MNIFSRQKEDDQVEVPEIEVRGDEATVRDDDDPPQRNRSYKLPKTKWF
jgi:hypothetical protein